MVSARSSNTGDMTQKKLAKQVQRSRDRYDRELAHLTSLMSDSHKFHARFPLRSVAESQGLQRLSKNEVKEDERLIAKDTLFLSGVEGTEEEELALMPTRSARPPVNPESALLHKVKRFQSWLSHPVQRGKDLDSWHVRSRDAKARLLDIEREEEDWCVTFERGRKLCLQSLQHTQRRNALLKKQSKSLLTLCRQKSMQANSSTSTKPKPFTQRELVDELVRRETAIAEKRTAAQQLLHSSKVRVVRVSLSQSDCAAVRALPTDAGTTTIATSSSLAHSPSIAVKREGEGDGDNQSFAPPPESAPQVKSEEIDLHAESRELLRNLQQMSEAVQRSETQLHALDGVFPDPDGDAAAVPLLDTLLLKELCEDGEKDKAQLAERFVALCGVAQGEEAVAATSDGRQRASALLNSFFASLDPTGPATRKKRKLPSSASSSSSQDAQRAVPLRSFALHLTDRGVPLRFSPASSLEDKCLGALRGKTLFTKLEHFQFSVANPVPASLVAMEDEIIARLGIQSEIANTATMIDRLRHSVAENDKLLHDAQIARDKAIAVYQQTVEQDVREREKMRSDLEQHGFCEPTAPRDALPVDASLPFEVKGNCDKNTPSASQESIDPMVSMSQSSEVDMNGNGNGNGNARAVAAARTKGGRGGGRFSRR